MNEVDGIPPTYVPARNIIFLALAASVATRLGARMIAIGTNSLDYSGYPDCRPDFISSMAHTLRLGLDEPRFLIWAPLQSKSKAEIIQKGRTYGVDFTQTWSCYNGREKACGTCPSCRIRLAAFAEVGIPDPLEYE